MNLSIGREENWGELVRVDPLSHFFLNKLELLGLVDVEPVSLSPTWSNNRSGHAGVHKHLDRFLVHHSLL
jgi:hypothetical protein